MTIYETHSFHSIQIDMHTLKAFSTKFYAGHETKIEWDLPLHLRNAYILETLLEWSGFFFDLKKYIKSNLNLCHTTEHQWCVGKSLCQQQTKENEKKKLEPKLIWHKRMLKVKWRMVSKWNRFLFFQREKNRDRNNGNCLYESTFAHHVATWIACLWYI